MRPLNTELPEIILPNIPSRNVLAWTSTVRQPEYNILILYQRSKNWCDPIMEQLNYNVVTYGTLLLYIKVTEAQFIVPDWGVKVYHSISGCRTGPSGYIGRRVGTTTICLSRLYPPLKDYKFGYSTVNSTVYQVTGSTVRSCTAKPLLFKC